LILEKPREKNMVLTNWDIWEYFRQRFPKLPDYELIPKIFRETGLSSRNIPHQPYTSKNDERKRRSYYRFSHYKLNPCYIGCLPKAVKKLEKILERLDKFAEKKKGDPELSDKEIEEKKLNPGSMELSKLQSDIIELQEFVKKANEYTDENYIPNPNDANFIYSVIQKAR